MRRYLDWRTFSARLILSTVVLILLTTLSAGLPALWLTQRELTRQAALYVLAARQATESLVVAERRQLRTLAVLLSERPTLQRLIRSHQLAELADYLRIFQQGSSIDALLLCDRNGVPFLVAQTPQDCALSAGAAMQQLTDHVALVARQTITDSATGEQLGTVILLKWVDRPFLQQLAADTGVEQTVVSATGVRLDSSLPITATVSGPPAQIASAGQVTTLAVNGQRYYATTIAFAADHAPTTVQLEVALAAEPLRQTSQRALGILVASTGLVAVLGLLVGVGYVQHLVRPLQHLTQMARQIGRGELSTPVPTFSGPAEITTLATALERSQARMLQALDELAGARDWLDHLLQTVVEGVITLNSEGHVTFLNQKAALLTPFATTTAIGRHLNELFPIVDDSNTRFFDLIPQPGHKRQVTITHGKRERAPDSATLRMMQRFGQPPPRRLGIATPMRKIVLELTTIKLARTDPNASQLALVIRDLSEEELLRNLRSYFLANITHEFRTPLSTFSASLELLLNEEEAWSPLEMRALLKPVQLSLLSLQMLVDNLLESSSIEAGRFAIQKRLVAFHQLTAQALQIVQPLLARRQQSMTLAEPKTPVKLHVDGPRLTQVLVNLLTNASKYSPMAEAITLTVEVVHGHLRVTVADRGPGVASTELATLFQSYVRANNHAEDQYGVGLGLYVVKTTVEAHNGRVGVNARPDGGSSFWFELPLDIEE